MTFITHVLLLVALLNLHLPHTHSVEFIPSTSWQVLPPEDSVPAGLHIRVDMETGQRWAKIAVEGDEDLITTREQVEGMRTGSSGGGRGGAGGGGSTAMIVGGDGETDEEDDNFDYDLMYRTYERIPEKDRPDLPDRSDPKFKVVMRELWDKRQAQLKSAMEKIADMPTVLESLIKSLNVPEERSMALSELAYLLSDIDLARDFYILKGWIPLLQASQDTSVTETDRAVAVMAMGTAVRNHVEFYHWADEDTMNAVLTNLMLAKEQGAVVKALGGLGSIIRGNDIGREVWRDIGGEKGVKDIAKKWGHDVRVITRLVTLASDVLNDSSDPLTVSSWGGNDWCGWTVGAMRKADDAGAQEKLMKAFKILKTHCEEGGVEKTKLKGVVGKMRKGWKKLDDDYKKELEKLADEVLGDAVGV